MLATLLLGFLTPTGSAAFLLTLSAFLLLLAMHAVYWIVTHPVNNFWLKDFKLKGLGAGFFSFRTARRIAESTDWTVLRDRWEHSHVVRAVLALVSLTLLVTAVV